VPSPNLTNNDWKGVFSDTFHLNSSHAQNGGFVPAFSAEQIWRSVPISTEQTIINLHQQLQQKI